MKLNSMDAVGMNVDAVQVKVRRGTDTGHDIPVSAYGAEKAAGLHQKIHKAAYSWSQGDSKNPQQDDQANNKLIKEAIEKVNKVISADNRKFEITIHEKTKDILVKVVDTDTNETIKEIPPKKIVDIVVSLCELAGIIFDAKG